MTHPDQYMIYHLVSWNEEKNKWNKKPVGLDGNELLKGAGIPTHPDRAAVAARIFNLNALCQRPEYVLGLWLSPESNFFFLDLDDNAVQDGRLTPLAHAMAAPLVAAGCYFEASTSGRGAHVIGRLARPLPPHSTSRKRVHPHEFYTRDRGVVLSAASSGSWDAVADPTALVLEYFPPRTAEEDRLELTDGPRAEWRGPADDDQLVLRMLGSTGSAVARLRGVTSVQDLWAGRCAHTSEDDLALASHLAFWTGCDVARIERLMRRSALARDKWDESRPSPTGGDSTWLRNTIVEAVTTTRTVYVEPQRVDTASAILGTPRVLVKPLTPPQQSVTELLPAPELDWHAIVDQTIAQINNAGTYREVHDVVMPSLGAMGFPRSHGERIVTALSKKLEIFDAKLPLATLRALVMPPAAVAGADSVPEWAQSLVYLTHSDKFFDTISGAEYTHEACRMVFNRYMPMRSTGVREDAVGWLRDRWQIAHVEDAEYRPDQPTIFEHAGRQYANRFLASTMPTPVAGSAECVECIQLFQSHLYDITARRAPLYWSLLHWIAHNVQRPGVKIRWSPLIKGVPGDGKSIIGDLLFAAMGAANVKVTSPSTISNSGGFTDWALGCCVNVIEEIRLEGKERRKLYNAMKTIIGDSRIDPNRKGRSSGLTLVNVTNHAAFTNYQDAVPTENGDRRWMVMFTPWGDAAAAASVKLLPSADHLPAYFKRLGVSMRAEPGAWRAWLAGIDLSSFDADGRAPWTEERDAMTNSSEDYSEQTVRDVIQQGGTGVDIEAFCSASLMARVQVVLGEKPDTRSWNRILTDLGYQQLKPLWWNGKTRRVWVKKMMSNDSAVEILNKSAFTTAVR